MDELTAFERRVAAALDEYVGPRRAVDAVAIAQVASGAPAARRFARPSVGRVPWRLVGAVAVLVSALAAGAVFVGSQTRVPALIERAGNGVVAYAFEGDIYVGDPYTGRTDVIVGGPATDSSPRFSPDGTRIAFIRGDRWSPEAAIVVVLRDGAAERVVMPAGYAHRGVDFAWTPDSASILVYHDSLPFTTPYHDGELSLADAAGGAELRRLTPPLPIAPGGGFVDTGVPFAPMFRPPDADLILSSGTNAISLWDLDLKRVGELVPEGLSYELFSVCRWCVAWSPDGSKISFVINVGPPTGREPVKSFVMDSDGSDVREMPSGTWSPDSSKLAYQGCSSNVDRPGAWIAIVDVATGAEHVLEATSVITKTDGSPPPDTVASPRPPDIGYCGWGGGADWRVWDYEGWSWSPDGRAIVFLEQTGQKPKVVDISSGVVSELPWEADSPPSWQRLAQ